MTGAAMSSTRSAISAMYTGLVLTVAAIVVAFVGQTTGDLLADHIRSGYPAYSAARVDSAVTASLVVLSVVGALGIGSWGATIWAVTSGRRWARLAATVLFVFGTVLALTVLLVRDTSGDTGFPMLLGVLGLLPCLPGLAAVALLWTAPPSASGTDENRSMGSSVGP